MRGLAAPLIKLIVFLVVTSFLTYALAVTIANKNFGSTYGYHAEFTDATGLQVGDDVRIAGVKVGSVNGVRIVRHNTAEVSFSVVKTTPLPKSVIVSLRYRNLAGQRYLDVSQGAGPTNALFPRQQVIPIAQTRDAVDLTVLFNGFKPLFQGLDPNQVNRLSDSIIKVLQGESGSVFTLFTNLSDLTNDLADKDQLIGEVVDNLSDVLSTVADHDQELSSLITELQTFVSGLAADRNTIADSIDGINSLATSTADLLTRIRPSLKSDVSDLSALTAGLASQKGDLDYFLQNLPTSAAKLIRTGSYGSWFNFYLCRIRVQLKVGSQTINVPAINTGNAQRCQA